MKSCILFIILVLYADISFSQSDSLSRNKRKITKGFYLTYKEFLVDSPSIIRDFTTEYFYHPKRNDSIIIRAAYHMPDSLDNFNCWGFSDGQDIFVAKFNKGDWKYWKAQCDGKNPYLYYTPSHNMLLFAFTPLIAAPIVAAANPGSGSNIFFINNKGQIVIADRSNLKGLLRDHPSLLKEFKADKYANENSYIQYILRYNDAKK